MGLLVLLLLTGAQLASAQFHSDRLYGLRIGTDLSRIAMHYLNPYRTDVTVHADARIDAKWYLVAEAGWNKTDLENPPVFNYKSQGYFLKAGADYNLLKPTFPFESNMVYVGFRYGIARMERSIPSYQISYPFWGDVKGSFGDKTLLPQWAEAVLGMKVQVLNNLFLDWGLHLRLLTTRNVDQAARPYVIPGFGKATSNAVFDANYTISYRIPLWKPKPPKPKLDKDDKNKNKNKDNQATPPQGDGPAADSTGTNVPAAPARPLPAPPQQ